MSTNDNTSSVKAAIDSVTGTAQSLLGSLTGSTSDQVQGDNKADKASVEKDLSHAAPISVGGVSVGPTGVSANDPNRSAGSWNQTIGSGKEMVGNIFGLEGLKKEGIQQNTDGKAQEAQGQLSDLAGGAADRLKGAAGGVMASVTGDKESQESYQLQHDTGKTAQRSAESDIQKQAKA